MMIIIIITFIIIIIIFISVNIAIIKKNRLADSLGTPGAHLVVELKEPWLLSLAMR